MGVPCTEVDVELRLGTSSHAPSLGEFLWKGLNRGADAQREPQGFQEGEIDVPDHLPDTQTAARHSGGPASAGSKGSRLSAEKWGTNKSTDPFLASVGLTAFRPSPQPSRMGVSELLQRGSACHGDARP